MKKVALYLIGVLLIVAIVFAWLLLGSGTDFNENRKYLLVYTGKSDQASVMAFVKEHELLKHPGIFEWIADKMNVWSRLKPGRFEIKRGESIVTIARMLRNNRQSAVNLVINKLRTKEDFASIISRNFEADSVRIIDFITTRDSIRSLGVDQNTFMTIVFKNK
jgi:UPF0755 protein